MTDEAGARRNRVQQRTVAERLLTDGVDRGAGPGEGLLHVRPRSAPLTSFTKVATAEGLQLLGTTEQVGLLEFGFDHATECERATLSLLDAEGGITVQIEVNGTVSDYQVATPWAIDANGQELPTWYEVDGNVLRQVVDARQAEAPIIFDPSYEFMPCDRYDSDLDAYDYLNMYDADEGSGICPVYGMFQSRNNYDAVYGFETNVTNDFGAVAVRRTGDCSPPGLPTGPSWDFLLPCQAHDYCYDLRKAGFSGTVTDEDCDDAFFFLMNAHCNDRVLSEACYLVRDAYYQAVALPQVVTPPDPGLVTLNNQATHKCADVEGPSTAEGTPIQQWQCNDIPQQRYRIRPVDNEPGLFYIESEYSGLCVRANPTTVYQSFCDGAFPSEHFRLRGGYTENIYALNDENSGFNRCVSVPNASTTNGTNLTNPTCLVPGASSLWRISDA